MPIAASSSSRAVRRRSMSEAVVEGLCGRLRVVSLLLARRWHVSQSMNTQMNADSDTHTHSPAVSVARPRRVPRP
eukprot:1721956-Prymnesium_polylepis.1